MRLPVIAGTIERRILVNYRVDPDTIQPLIPAPLRPQIRQGYALAGICLIRLGVLFPPGSIAFDCALSMRGVEHERHGQEELCCTEWNASEGAA